MQRIFCAAGDRAVLCGVLARAQGVACARLKVQMNPKQRVWGSMSLPLKAANLPASDRIESRETLASECRDMGEVRAEIDRIDRRLVALLAERQGYIEAAARLKTRAEEVRLQWRIEDVLAKVLAEAELMGLSKRIAEPVWRELMDRCIEHEHERWRQFHARND